MNILFISDYFYPFVHGGAEQSVLELAKDLVKKGVEVDLLTPNYGAKKQENLFGIDITRFDFPKKLKSHSDQLTPNWHFNPIYWFNLSKAILNLSKKRNIDIIHCQSVYCLIPGVLIGKLLRKPVLVTFRDDQ